MIRELGESIGGSVLRRMGRAYGRVQERTPLQSDLLEGEDSYLVVFDAPGAAASDVQVKYVNGTVMVRVDRFRDFHEGFEMRFPGRGLSLDGEVELPADAEVDPDAAEATLTDRGTLEVKIPKRTAGEDEVAIETVDADDVDETAGSGETEDRFDPGEADGGADQTGTEDDDVERGAEDVERGAEDVGGGESDDDGDGSDEIETGRDDG